MCRGAAAAEQAAETARRTFAEGGAGDALPQLSVPGGSIGVVEALVGLGFAGSNGEARRKIAEGAVRVDGEPLREASATIAVGGSPVRLSLGKKRHGLLVA